MKVTVKPYDPKWAERFQELKQQIEAELGSAPYESIEHVGSTSVPGLSAKPVIDIDVIVARADVEASVAALQRSGRWSYWGPRRIPDRHMFKSNPPMQDEGGALEEGQPLPCNLYVIVAGCLSLRNHLAVRDACRRDEKLREEYKRVKEELATREWVTVDGYVQAKSEVLARVLERSGLSEEELEEIREVNRARPA